MQQHPLDIVHHTATVVPATPLDVDCLTAQLHHSLTIQRTTPLHNRQPELLANSCLTIERLPMQPHSTNQTPPSPADDTDSSSQPTLSFELSPTQATQATSSAHVGQLGHLAARSPAAHARPHVDDKAVQAGSIEVDGTPPGPRAAEVHSVHSVHSVRDLERDLDCTPVPPVQRSPAVPATAASACADPVPHHVDGVPMDVMPIHPDASGTPPPHVNPSNGQAPPAKLLVHVQAAVQHALDTCPTALSSLWTVFPFQIDALEYARECQRLGRDPGRAWRRAHEAGTAKAAPAPPKPSHEECWPMDGSQAVLSLEQLACSAQPLQLLQGGGEAAPEPNNHMPLHHQGPSEEPSTSQGSLFDMGASQYEALLRSEPGDTAVSGPSTHTGNRTTSVEPTGNATTGSGGLPTSSGSLPVTRKRRRDGEPAKDSLPGAEPSGSPSVGPPCVWLVSQERARQDGERGTRHFVVTSLPALWNRYSTMQPRHVYEVRALLWVVVFAARVCVLLWLRCVCCNKQSNTVDGPRLCVKTHRAICTLTWNFATPVTRGWWGTSWWTHCSHWWQRRCGALMDAHCA